MLYKFTADSDSYRSLTYVNEEDADMTADWGKPDSLMSTWKPIEVEYFNEEGNDRLPIGDIAGFAGPAMSPSTAELLRPMIGPFGEFLPLKHIEGYEYLAFHVTHVCECLDLERAQVSKTRRGIIYLVNRHEFDFDKIDPNHPVIFKDPRVSTVPYATGGMKSLLEKTGVTGFKFDKVWPHGLRA